MLDDILPPATEARLLAASGYPYLPARVRYSGPAAWHPVRDGEPAARYLYTGPDGEPRFEVIRFHPRAPDPGGAGKAFLSRRVDGAGGWAWGLDGVELAPYRLPRVREAAAAGGRVYVVEGEKDVQALEAAGLTATCNPLGALQWVDAYAGALRGAEVVIVPDNDRVGRLHAARVAASLRGCARSVAVLLPPGMDAGRDVGDWLAAGHTGAELDALADDAPRDPDSAQLAERLGFLPGLDPRDATPGGIRRLLTARPGEAAAPASAAFPRTRAAFARLGHPVPPALPEPGLPDAHAAYRAVLRTVQAAGAEAAPLLRDASLLERTCHAMALFAGLVRAAAEAEAEPAGVEGEDDHAPLATAPSARLVRTQWDWDGFLAGADAAPARSGGAWVVHLPPAGALQVRRLHALPALILELCAAPRTPAGIAAEVAGRVEGDAGRLAAVVRAQLGELRGAGLLRTAPGDPVEGTLGEMRALLYADGAPAAGPRGLAGMLTRAARAAGDLAGEVEEGGGLSERYQLDLTVDVLEGLLDRARLRPAFAEELEGYWIAADVGERIRRLTPLLEMVGSALGAASHPPPPFVLS